MTELKTVAVQGALEEIQSLAPSVAGMMADMLGSPKVPAVVKVRIMELILERTYGKAETAIRLNTNVQANEAAHARLEAIAARIRLEVEREDEEDDDDP